jgi:LysR family transcriptional regulator, regulator for metE and metH
MININLQQLKIVQAIATEDSMTKAAEKLFVSQSALSHQLKDIEKNLGITVFERYNKKLLLTEAGRFIVQTAEVIIIALERLEVNIESLTIGNNGTIRISTECFSSYNWLPKLMTDFNKKEPNAKIKIVAEATFKTTEFLENGQLDIAITSRVKPPNCKLKYHTLFKDELMVVMHKSNPLAIKKNFMPNDFETQTLLVYDMDEEELDIFNYVLKPSNVKPHKLIKLPLTEIIIEMVKANAGVTVMANWLAAPMLNKDMVLVPLKHSFAKRTWFMVSQNCNNKLQENFIAFAASNLRKENSFIK